MALCSKSTCSPACTTRAGIDRPLSQPPHGAAGLSIAPARVTAAEFISLPCGWLPGPKSPNRMMPCPTTAMIKAMMTGMSELCSCMLGYCLTAGQVVRAAEFDDRIAVHNDATPFGSGCAGMPRNAAAYSIEAVAGVVRETDRQGTSRGSSAGAVPNVDFFPPHREFPHRWSFHRSRAPPCHKELP
jgi:hypothetical protein